ncbi:hypothetical protein [Polymorphospora rubra]|uniref:Uncharacterized protein n=1 Tax=Polymorphospora rubra TaxID=338584 RepID=A0A810MSX0_9ACTN|nr:hypothetical protein [Polymorphospora rubra]BCJ64131.1 hypothetical protein Prubr_11520 [Polymorphospora rubra]
MTTLHPHQLAAAAWAWHLGHALAHLEQLAAEAQRLDAHARLEYLTRAPDGLQGWRPVIGRSGGGHGDPVGSTALLDGPATRPPLPAAIRWTTLASNAHEMLRWLAARLGLPRGGAPLEALTAAIPAMRSSTAAELAKWLRERDGIVRAKTGRPADWLGMPYGAPCPACAGRSLRRALTDDRGGVVLCQELCVCAGAGCGCGMPQRGWGGRMRGSGARLWSGCPGRGRKAVSGRLPRIAPSSGLLSFR